jgi:N-acylneuraminate cytidylyltransferase
MNILALILARSESKTIKNKNIRMMNENPMMAYSIEHARSSKYINRVIVSTDNELYADIVRT